MERIKCDSTSKYKCNFLFRSHMIVSFVAANAHLSDSQKQDLIEICELNKGNFIENRIFVEAYKGEK